MLTVAQGAEYAGTLQQLVSMSVLSVLLMTGAQNKCFVVVMTVFRTL